MNFEAICFTNYYKKLHSAPLRKPLADMQPVCHANGNTIRCIYNHISTIIWHYFLFSYKLMSIEL